MPFLPLIRDVLTVTLQSARTHIQAHSRWGVYQLTRADEGPLLVVSVIAARGNDVGVIIRKVAVAVHVEAVAILSINYCTA